MAATVTDVEVLDTLAEHLTTAYTHPDGGDRDRLPHDLARRIDSLFDEALRHRQLTARQIASHSRLPGRWVIGWLHRPADHAVALQAEIHHAERQLAQLRLDRAHYARRLTLPDEHRPRTTKTAIAALFGVSRPTIDAWIADSEAVSPMPHLAGSDD